MKEIEQVRLFSCCRYSLFIGSLCSSYYIFLWNMAPEQCSCRLILRDLDIVFHSKHTRHFIYAWCLANGMLAPTMAMTHVGFSFYEFILTKWNENRFFAIFCIRSRSCIATGTRAHINAHCVPAEHFSQIFTLWFIESVGCLFWAACNFERSATVRPRTRLTRSGMPHETSTDALRSLLLPPLSPSYLPLLYYLCSLVCVTQFWVCIWWFVPHKRFIFHLRCSSAEHAALRLARTICVLFISSEKELVLFSHSLLIRWQWPGD